MSSRAHGQLRRGQVITTYGPGALIDLPRHSAILGGLDTWPRTGDLEEIVEPRLTRKLQFLTGVPLPLISYSGSFALMIMFALGVVNSVWVHRHEVGP